MKVANSQKLAASTKHPKHQVLTKKSHPVTGAPAQHNQPSRKGKRAWRKNVDIGEVDEGLEEMRAEERVTGLVCLYLHGSSSTRCCKGWYCRK
jgi:nucleolar protein 53